MTENRNCAQLIIALLEFLLILRSPYHKFIPKTTHLTLKTVIPYQAGGVKLHIFCVSVSLPHYARLARLFSLWLKNEYRQQALPAGYYYAVENVLKGLRVIDNPLPKR